MEEDENNLFSDMRQFMHDYPGVTHAFLNLYNNSSNSSSRRRDSNKLFVQMFWDIVIVVHFMKYSLGKEENHSSYKIG